MAWTSYQRAKASERFWKPVIEQANVLIDHINEGRIFHIDDISDYIDHQLFGDRYNSPVFRRALYKYIDQYTFLAA